MSLVPEEDLLAADTERYATPIVRKHLPGADVHSDCFDAYVTYLHGTGEVVDKALAFRIARELRGGRDVDLKAPTDWHVRSMGPHRRCTDRADDPRNGERIGTSIWFSTTYAIPDGYDESEGEGDTIEAPGGRLLSAS